MAQGYRLICLRMHLDDQVSFAGLGKEGGGSGCCGGGANFHDVFQAVLKES